MRKALGIFKILVASIAALAFGAWILLQAPRVQTAIAGKVLTGLESKLGGRISVSEIRLKPFNAVVIKDLTVTDSEPPVRDSARIDTLFNARTVVATFSIRGLSRKEGLKVGRATVSDGCLTLTSEENGSNLKRLINRKNPKKKKEQGDVFSIRKVRIDNFRFRLVNLRNPKEKDYGINWGDLDVLVGGLQARDLKLSGGYMSGELQDLSADEKSGYRIRSLSGKAVVGHGKTAVEEIMLSDSWSDLHIPLFTMSYDNPKSFRNFVDEVRMELKACEGDLSLRSLAFFAPVFKDRDVCLDLREAEAEGTVNELNVKELSFTEKESSVRGQISGTISGATSGRMLRTSCKVRGLSFTAKTMEQLLWRAVPGLAAGPGRPDLKRFEDCGPLVLNLSGNGPLDNLDIEGSLTSGNAGSLEAQLQVRDLSDTLKPAVIEGSLRTENLNIGKLAGTESLGECTMRCSLSSKLEKKETSVSIDTLFIDRLSLLDYDYSNIVAAGTYSENAFNGRIICNDPNLSFLFQGVFTFSDKTKNGLYKFYANVGYADLQALKLDRRGGTSKVSGQVNANYMSISKGDIIGKIDLSGIVLESGSGRHNIGGIRVESHSNNSINRVNLSSSFATASYVGSKPLTSLAGALQELTVQREVPALLKKRVSGWKGEEYEARIDFHDSRDLLSFVLPGLYIAGDTELRLNVRKDGGVLAKLKSPRLALGKNYLKDFLLSLDNSDGKLSLSLTSSETSAPVVDLLDNRVVLTAKDNHIGASFTYDNRSALAGRGDVFLSADLERSGDGLGIKAGTLPSSIFYNNGEWKISSSSIGFSGGNLKVDNLTATCGEQKIRLDGGISGERRDSLALELTALDVSLLNRFLKQDFGIGGKASGRAFLKSPLKDKSGLMLNLRCDSTVIAGRPAGTLLLASTLDEKNRMQVIARNDIEGERTFNISGEINPKTRVSDFGAEFNGMDVSYLTPLLSSVFSQMGGQMSGKVRIGGGSDSGYHFSSEGTRFDNALLKVGFTNVSYTVNGPFTVSDKGLVFNNLSVSDRQDGSGTVSGGLYFSEDRKSLRLDTRISMNRMECLNTSESDNPSFYGRLFAGGDVRIAGPLNAIVLDVNATTSKEGSIHIPLDNTSQDRTNDLLYFREIREEKTADPYELMMESLEKEKKRSNDFGVRLRVSASPQVQAFVELDKAAGNVLTGRGQGLLDINVQPGRDIFTINGDYTLSEGSFHFNAMGIAKRDFTIRDGSSIRFNGDVNDSDLSISGNYSTKASVATLIADTTSTTTRRTVNCGIGISGKLRNPDLSFSIDVPDLDPTTKSKVESALNTEDKIQRQFLTLLISGNFMPDEQSGIVNNTNSLYNNVAEIMAGQLNSILQKLDIPLDLGLNYQSKESGTDIFDVAVSTKLFNDRVLVNGALGNREYGTASTNRDVAGDIDIEIKLDKPGQLRLNLFSHSADSYSTYLDNTQRSGVGLTFQKEFNSLRDFLRDLFTGKKKRAEAQSGQLTEKSGASPNRITVE